MERGPILIVEDDKDLAAALVDALVQAGVGTVAVVCDGVDALRWLHANGSPSLVLLDLQLPRASGDEIWAYIRDDEDLQAVPTIVMTGAAEVSLEAFEGVADILRKPVALDRLVAAVRRFVK